MACVDGSGVECNGTVSAMLVFLFFFLTHEPCSNVVVTSSTKP